jgi:protein involved in polysaccharide export with SLBB domain
VKQILLSLALLATVTGTGAAQQPASDALRPGDSIRLHLVVPGEGEPGQGYSGDYMIDETGSLSLPLIEPLQATSMSAQDLRARIIQQYQSLFRNQAIQVTALRRVSVLGAVRNPGLYHVDPTMRIGDVIATAGGVTTDGRPNEVRIIRDGQEITTELTPESVVPQELRSGDQIIIPERSWVARNFPWLVGLGMTVTALLVRGYR